MRSLPVILGILAAVAARPHRAEACTCATPAVQVFPGASEVAPTNSHLYLIVPLEVVGALDKVVFEVRPLSPKGGDRSHKRRHPKRKKSQAAIEVDRRETVSSALGFVELTPKAPLAPETRYQLWMTLSGGKPAVVGELTTGTAADTTAPSWSGISGATWKSAPATPGTCQTGRAHVLLQHTPATDPEGNHVLYGVWTADAAGRLDYAAPPRGFAVDWNGRLALGPASACVPSNLEIPASGGLRLGLKAIDRAGNASAASEPKVSPPASKLPAASIRGK